MQNRESNSNPENVQSSQLREVLADREAISQHTTIWAGGRIHLEVSAYLVEPGKLPASLVTSGRCIVLCNGSVLVMRNEDSTHILPGGRIEHGEDSRSAATREVEEEAGIVARSLSPFATLIFRHLTPKPEGYPYPYPTFINDIYIAQLPIEPRLAFADTYERSGTFIPIREAVPLIAEHEAKLLHAATTAVGD